MPANSTHADYDAALPEWTGGHDLLAGEDAVKAAGERYLPKLDAQTQEEHLAYQSRACFFNAMRRAADYKQSLHFAALPMAWVAGCGRQTLFPWVYSKEKTQKAVFRVSRLPPGSV